MTSTNLTANASKEPTSAFDDATDDAIALTIEYSESRQSLLWMVEYGGALSCWSERSIQEAIGGLLLASVGDDWYKDYSLIDCGINFDGFNYRDQSKLGQAVMTHLIAKGYHFSQRFQEEPDLVICGLETKGDD